MHTDMPRDVADEWCELLETIPDEEVRTEAWRGEAVCASVDADLFFPEAGTATNSFLQPKRVCRRCPVRLECLRFAVTSGEEFGVWGGLAAMDVAAVRVEWRARRAAERAAVRVAA